MAEKDPFRAQRLNEVYKHLFAHHGVESKTQLADILGVQRTGLAAAFGGNKANLTDNLFKKICGTFQGIFNLNYLLTGNGDLLTIEEEVKSEELMAPSQPAIPDYVQRLCDEAARIATRSEMLERSLSNAVAESRELKEQLAATVNDNRTLRQQLSDAVTAVAGMKSQMDMLLGLFRVTPGNNRIIIPQQIVSEFSDDYTTAQPLATYDDSEQPSKK